MGVPDNTLATFGRKEDAYIVTMKYPDVFGVLENCSVGDTRRQVMTAFNNRGGQKNIDLLTETIELRKKAVHILGYPNYPSYALENEMAETPENVKQFLFDLRAKLEASGRKELEELTIAGCWVHCRRRFNDALKIIDKRFQENSEAFLILKQIQAIYREEGKLGELSSEERLKQRQAVIKPLVDAFFAYLKTIKASRKDKFGDAVGYALNQERYLRVFLTDGDVPIDNNASERAIRGFCIGKNVYYGKNGSSAIIRF